MLVRGISGLSKSSRLLENLTHIEFDLFQIFKLKSTEVQISALFPILIFKRAIRFLISFVVCF